MAWEEQKGGNSNTIKFEDHPVVVGELMDRRPGVGQYNSTVYDLKLVDGSDVVVSFFTNDVLDDRLKYVKTQVQNGQGELVKITYLGQVPPKNYKNFQVQIDKEWQSGQPVPDAVPLPGVSDGSLPEGMDAALQETAPVAQPPVAQPVPEQAPAPNYEKIPF